MGEMADLELERWCGIDWDEHDRMINESFQKRILESRSKIWIQRDGTPIRVKNMSVGHLANTIAMIKRGNPTQLGFLYIEKMQAQLDKLNRVKQ